MKVFDKPRHLTDEKYVHYFPWIHTRVTQIILCTIFIMYVATIQYLNHWRQESKTLNLQFIFLTYLWPWNKVIASNLKLWTLTAEMQRRIRAMKMRCYRKLPRISYKDHVSNEEVRVRIQHAIGPNEDLLTMVNRRKLQWYGHVSRSSGPAKTILQGTVKGEEDKADRGRGGKTTSGNGQVWSSASPRGQWGTGENGEN